MKPEWTPEGHERVQRKDYQYFSVEILPDNQLRAVSLVNFPAIKGMYPATKPVTLGEGPVFLLKEFLMAEQEKDTKKLGDKCPECDGPVPDGSKACPHCGADLTSEKEKEMPEEKNTLSEGQLEELQAQLTQLKEERDSLSAKLEETTKTQGTEVASLAETVKAQSEQISSLIELNNMLRLHEKVVDFMQLEETPNRQITPAYEEPITKVLLLAEDLDKEAEILDLMKALASGAAVFELGERGTSAIPESTLNEGPDVDRTKLHEDAVKLSQERGIKYTEALMELSRKELK
jgi:hypothetical protein